MFSKMFCDVSMLQKIVYLLFFIILLFFCVLTDKWNKELKTSDLSEMSFFE